MNKKVRIKTLAFIFMVHLWPWTLSAPTFQIFYLSAHFCSRPTTTTLIPRTTLLLDRAPRPARLVLLSDVVGGGGRAHRYLGLVPVPIVLQRVEDVLGVRVHQVGPRLPQWMDDVVDEPDLGIKVYVVWYKITQNIKSKLIWLVT